MKQVMYKRNEANSRIHSGILLANGDLICGHCGKYITESERTSNYVLLKVFDDWVNLDEFIKD